MFLYGEKLTYFFIINSISIVFFFFSRCVRVYGVPLGLERKTVVIHNTCLGPKEHRAETMIAGVKRENVCLKIETR